MTKMDTIQIYHDVHMPVVGFGTYLIDAENVQAAVSSALEHGYRHIDTAEKYENEEGVGAAIHAKQLVREEIFITTKVWPGSEAWGETPKTYDTTIETMHASLNKLQLDYVDLYLIHAPFEKDHRLEQWRALTDLQQQGKARAIGVSNFNQLQIDGLVNAGLPTPAVNQIELHPWSQKQAHIDYLKKHGITPMPYSSLAPLSTWRVAEDQGSGKTDETIAERNLETITLETIANKHQVKQSQILLRWALQKGYPVIPKSTKPERIALNFDLFRFTLDDNDMSDLESMERNTDLAWGQNFFEF